MVNSLENIDKSKVYVDRIEGLDEVVEDVIGDTLVGAVSTITTSDLTAGKILVSDANGKVAASDKGIADISGINNKITNCITEIPQDINLELNNGTLTLKAGSKVYVPNGVGVFDVATISSDRTYTYTAENSTRLLMYDQDEYYLYSAQIENCYSGSSAPTNISTTAYWYDTTNNLIKKTTNGGSTWTANTGTLPLAVISVSGGQIISIDQVFNGFGYIGSTAFVLPGVKGLAPNGRNDDGTLKNVNIKFTQVSMTTDTSGATGGLWYVVANNSITRINYGTLTYDTKHNYIYVTSSGSIQHNIIIDFNAYRTSGKITSFNPKTTFHAVDYNDFSNLKDVVDTKANDSNVVHKSGNEIINGEKTFINSVITNNILPKGDITLGTSTNTWGKQLQFRDTTGKRIARIQPKAIDTTNNRVGMWVNNADNSVETGIYIDSDRTTYAPTPSASDNSTKIATTAWVNSTGNNVVHKTGDETISGDKTFQTDILYKKSAQDFTTTPAQPFYTEIRNVDINNFEIGQFRVWKDTDGANVIDLLGRYQDNSVNFYGATLGIKSYSDGRSVAYAPTPYVDADGEEIATAAYVKNVLSAIYPVGSVYLGIQNNGTCPIASLIPGSTWELVSQDRALWGGNGTNANTWIAAGLPNITGSFNRQCFVNYGGGTDSGALYTGSGNSPQTAGGTDGGCPYTVSIDASRSNSIYGSSSTVQPPAYRVNVWVRTA